MMGLACIGIAADDNAEAWNMSINKAIPPAAHDAIAEVAKCM